MVQTSKGRKTDREETERQRLGLVYSFETLKPSIIDLYPPNASKQYTNYGLSIQIYEPKGGILTPISKTLLNILMEVWSLEEKLIKMGVVDLTYQ